MALMRDWVTPVSTTALVAWIVVPMPPPESSNYDRVAVSQHTVCAIERSITPNPGGYYQPDEFSPLIPSAGGTLRVVEAHQCLGSMNFTHLILEGGAGHTASVLVTRSGENSERTFRRRIGEFDVTQVRTTRRRAFLVLDRTHARELNAWREMTADRLRQFLKQLEGS